MPRLSLRWSWLLLLATAPTAAAQTPLGSAFTYQGRLTDAGIPPSAAYDFEFRLFDSAVAGTQVGPLVGKPNVAVADGLFTVTLDFGSHSFVGDALWLQVAVRPAGAGTYQTLAPRQALTASPYAAFSSAAPWSGVTDKPPGFADNVDNDTTYTAGAGLVLSGTAFGLADLGVTTAKLADNAVTSSKIANGTIALGDLGQNGCAATQVMKWSGTAWACAADADSGGDITGVTAGAGLTGGATTGNATLGVSFGGGGTATSVAHSDHGHFGQIWTGNGVGLEVVSATAEGVQSITAAPGGYGIVGVALDTTTTGYGVRGTSSSPSGGGVFGQMTAASGFNVGVLGQTSSSQGQAIRGNASAAAGATVGVQGQASSTGGTGVWGNATATSGPTVGVLGQTYSADGHGVRGRHDSSLGTAAGVLGESSSGLSGSAGVRGFGASQAAGVEGSSTFGPGVRATGLLTALEIDGAIRVPGAGDGTFTPVFVHRVTSANLCCTAISCPSTVIDHPFANAQPSVILIATPRSPHPVSVAYNTTCGPGRWILVRADGGSMVAGDGYNVLIVKP